MQVFALDDISVAGGHLHFQQILCLQAQLLCRRIPPAHCLLLMASTISGNVTAIGNTALSPVSLWALAKLMCTLQGTLFCMI